MSDLNFKTFITNQHANDFLNKSFVKKSILNEVIGFHQKQLWFPHEIIYENSIDRMIFLHWKKYLSETDISNEFSSDYFNVYEITNRGLDRFNTAILTLKAAMKSITSDVKSILPLIIVNSREEDYPLENGCYLFVESSNKLIQLRKWTQPDIDFLNECNIFFRENQELAIALAIDLRRSLLLDEIRGYRKTLIDTGRVTNSFERILKLKSGNLLKTEQILDFSDNALTKLCGLDVRLAPVISIQHIIMEELECIID